MAKKGAADGESAEPGKKKKRVADGNTGAGASPADIIIWTKQRDAAALARVPVQADLRRALRSGDPGEAGRISAQNSRLLDKYYHFQSLIIAARGG